MNAANTNESELVGARPVVDFDHLSPEGQEAHNAAWKELRGKCPVAWTEHNGGHWLASKHEPIAAAFRDWETFSSARLEGPELTSILVPSFPAALALPEELDPPEWTPYRKVIAQLLSPASVEKLRPRVQHWVSHFIDQVIETGHIDLANDLAGPVPGAVALEWLGFPEEDWRRISKSVHDGGGYPQGSPEFVKAMEDLVWMDVRISEEVADRRENPRDDAISKLANLDVDGEKISVLYAEGMVRLAIAGGVDTTTSVTTSALVHLARHPEDRESLLADLDLMETAAEEFLRMYPSARAHARTVTHDTVFEGCLMRKGERILISELSANHDEDVFPDAHEFQLDRFPNRHLSFGMGIHRCPGSHLARLQFKEMLTQVLTRLPDYALVEDEVMEYPNWAVLGGWTRVPATFTPGVRFS
jgi:cytochrome P450